MKERLYLFFNYFIFWVIIGIVARSIFMIYQHELSSELSAGEVGLSMLHGLRHDLAIAGYFSIIPGLFIMLLSNKALKYALLIYTGLFLFFGLFVVVLDMELYKHWRFRMDTTPLLYVGKGAAGSGGLWTTIILLSSWVILFVTSMFFFIKQILTGASKLFVTPLTKRLFLLVPLGCLFIPIRGSFGVAPLNTGSVYFHETNMFANHAAINVIYNFGYSLTKLNKLKYPETYYDKNQTQIEMNRLIVQDTLGPQLLNTSRPNVMVIVLESFTFKFIERLGGFPDVAPEFNSLVKEGVLFENFYASGDRTDMGIVSILNGYPRQTKGSIIKFPKKTATLPYINKTLKQLDYHTEFTFGNDINFANFRSYLTNGQFDRLTHLDDFPPEYNDSKWGVHDHIVFDHFLQETNEVKEPFFKIMMTLSSHEPFIVPMDTKIEGSDKASMFKNSAYYTDKSFGNFIKRAKETTWWENTLVIVTADHGHGMFLGDELGVYDPDRYKIPMLWLGGALQKRDTVISSFGIQTDIANTLFAQMGFQDPDYTFSSNMFSPNYEERVLFFFNDGYGYIDAEETIVYDNTARQFVIKEVNDNKNSINSARAYLQAVYSDFNSR